MNLPSTDAHLRQLLPFTLSCADRYAWSALGATVRADSGSAAHFARLSRLARGIAANIATLERGA